MYHPRDIPEYTGQALEAILYSCTKDTSYHPSFRVIFEDRPPGYCLVEFAPGDTIAFHVPSEYPTPERLGFFTNRWLSTWELFSFTRNRYPDLMGCCPMWLNDHADGTGLAFCGNTTSNVLIPDPIFLQSDGYAALRASFARQWVPWPSREDKVFWRGASTGDRRLLGVQHWHEMPRFRLCLLANEIDAADAFDVAISNIVQIGDADELAAIDKAGIVRGKVDLHHFMNYRHSIDIDGNTSSWPGLFTKFLMGNTVLKIDSPAGHRQWYYDRMFPWKHFIPISRDMSELVEIGHWLKAHPAKAMEIAAEGYRLASSLTMEQVLEEAATVVRDAVISWPANVGRNLASASMERLQAAATAPLPEPAKAHISQIEVSGTNDLTANVKAAFIRAWAGDCAIDPGVLQMAGMSGQKYRKFINNLIGNLDDASYLEVGTWTGSTLCAAINGNRVRAVAIDNWSQFGGPKQAFLENLQSFRTPAVDLSFIEDDFHNVDFASLGQHRIYLFDGPHSAQDHYDGIALATPALTPCFVLVVDDWNWEAVRTGTLQSLAALDMSILYSMEIRTTLDNSHPDVANEKSDWHNGYFIGVIQQPTA